MSWVLKGKQEFTRWVQREELGGSRPGPTNRAKTGGGKVCLEDDQGLWNGLGYKREMVALWHSLVSESLPGEAFEGRVKVLLVGLHQI